MWRTVAPSGATVAAKERRRRRRHRGGSRHCHARDPRWRHPEGDPPRLRSSRADRLPRPVLFPDREPPLDLPGQVHWPYSPLTLPRGGQAGCVASSASATGSWSVEADKEGSPVSSSGGGVGAWPSGSGVMPTSPSSLRIVGMSGEALGGLGRDRNGGWWSGMDCWGGF